MPFRSLPAALGILWISVFALPVSASPIPASSAVPQTHAHNDYEHPNPLYDALSWGFISAEADIWLYPDDNDNLRVAHDPVADPTTLPTLQELYLDPLVQQFNTHADGGIYADGTPLHLLVDIKSVGSPTYARLHQILADYADANPGLFTTFTKTGPDTWEVVEGAVNISISGNRPRADMEDQAVRYAAYDGRAADIGSGASSDFIRLISDNWNTFFSGFGWDGTGVMPTDILTAIDAIVAEVHAEDKLLRFWNLPNDGPNVWGPLFDAGVDYINTDDLAGLSTFVQQRQIPVPATALLLMAGLLGLLRARRR
jgi:hypothetical protein